VGYGSFLPRHHPHLVAVVEELKERCDRGSCRLCIQSFNAKYLTAYSIEPVCETSERVRFHPERLVHQAVLRLPNASKLRIKSRKKLFTMLMQLVLISEDVERQKQATNSYGMGVDDYEYSEDLNR